MVIFMKINIRPVGLLFVLCLLGGLLCSCGAIAESWNTVRLTGAAVTDTVVLEDCTDAIRLSVHLNFVNGGDNVIKVLPPPEGAEPYYEITYPADFIERGLIAHYDDGCLTVEIVPSRQGQRQFSTDAFSMTVYANVCDFDLVGSHTLRADHGGVAVPALNLHITGGAAAEMSGIAAETVTVRVDGAADVVLAGTAGTLETELNGAAALESTRLATQNAEITINGVGAAEIACSETLDAEINGAGSISYVGDPTVTKEINGAGAVSKRPDPQA
ncbi:MAG: hypothetical protein E7604_10805 [Ruminococcaceae bacterium]|nr:hypothetical protein [Oscillospiraceae bacterium]